MSHGDLRAKLPDAAPKTGPSIRVLLVDDNERILNVTALLLRNRGHHVVTASDSTEAVLCYRESWQDLDLVVLDMNMPRMNGVETYKAMREIRQDVKVILATGYGLNDKTRDALPQGIMRCMEKPFHIDQLLGVMQEVIREPPPAS